MRFKAVFRAVLGVLAACAIGMLAGNAVVHVYGGDNQLATIVSMPVWSLAGYLIGARWGH